MTTGNFVRCNTCEKTVFDIEAANGWFVLKTLLTKHPEVDIPPGFDPHDEEQTAAIEAELEKQLPPRMGGELCSVKCLMSFVSAHYGLEGIREVLDDSESDG